MFCAKFYRYTKFRLPVKWILLVIRGSTGRPKCVYRSESVLCRVLPVDQNVSTGQRFPLPLALLVLSLRALRLVFGTSETSDITGRAPSLGSFDSMALEVPKNASLTLQILQRATHYLACDIRLTRHINYVRYDKMIKMSAQYMQGYALISYRGCLPFFFLSSPLLSNLVVCPSPHPSHCSPITPPSFFPLPQHVTAALLPLFATTNHHHHTLPPQLPFFNALQPDTEDSPMATPPPPTTPLATSSLSSFIFLSSSVT